MSRTVPTIFTALFLAFVFTVCMPAFLCASKAFAVAKPAKAMIDSMNSKASGTLTLKAKKAKRAQGYRFKIGTNKTFTKNVKVKTVSKRKVTFKNLKHGKRYYVKARAYRVVKGKRVWGRWSARKSTVIQVDSPPSVSKIAAFGEYAVIVQALGGKGALAAADKELLSSDFSKVFAEHGASKIATGWGDDGQTADKMDVDVIIKSGAQAILVPSSSYSAAGNGLSKKDLAKLKAAGVALVVLYPLTNTTYLKKDVETVGAMLSSSKSCEFDSKARAAAYIRFHDNLVSRCVSANGGLAGTQVYELRNRNSYKANANAKYTLLVDEYDTSAHFNKEIGQVSLTTNGVGVATFNYSQTPISYYIQVGGLVNTGAAKSTESSKGTLGVWQFNTNIRNFRKDYWSYDSDGAFAKSDDAGEISAAGWDTVLTTASSERNGISVGSDIPITGLGASFGSPLFPRIIAGTRQVKEMMIENSMDEHGLYHAYGIPTKALDGSNGRFNPSTYGLAYSSTNILFASIGIDGGNGQVSTFASGVIPDSAICVNPHGLFDSWTEGTLEACLEAAWVTDVVNGEMDVGYEDLVKEFYATFYGYDLSASELDSILAGTVS